MIKHVAKSMKLLNMTFLFFASPCYEISIIAYNMTKHNLSYEIANYAGGEGTVRRYSRPGMQRH